jgi:hypothetical protein
MRLNPAISSRIRARAYQLFGGRKPVSWDEAHKIAIQEVARAERAKQANPSAPPAPKALSNAAAELWEMINRPLPVIDLRDSAPEPVSNVSTVKRDSEAREVAVPTRKEPQLASKARSGPLLYTSPRRGPIGINDEFRDDETTSNWRTQQRDRK